MTNRILILQLKRIGDCILTAPAVAALRARHPQAEIVMVVPEGIADLAACFAGVDRVLPYRVWSLNAAVWSSVLFGEWDACYDFTGTDRSALMTFLSRAKERYGYRKFSSKFRAKAYTRLCEASVRDLHTVDFHLGLVGATQSPSAEVFLHCSGTVPEVGAPYAIVHIGTAREEKFWSADRWAEVITELAKTHQIVLTGTNAGLERPHLDRLRALLPVPYTDLTGKLSLVQLAGLIERCELALGVDSMAMHLAAMFRRPQIVLFGPTNPYQWRPRHAKAIVLLAGQSGPVETFQPKAKGASMDLISTRMVLDAMASVLRSPN